MNDGIGKRFICRVCHGTINLCAPYEPSWWCEKCQHWYSEDFLMGKTDTTSRIDDCGIYRFPNSEGKPTIIPVDKEYKELFDKIDSLFIKAKSEDMKGGPHSLFWLIHSMHIDCYEHQKHLADYMTELREERE